MHLPSPPQDKRAARRSHLDWLEPSDRLPYVPPYDIKDSRRVFNRVGRWRKPERKLPVGRYRSMCTQRGGGFPDGFKSYTNYFIIRMDLKALYIIISAGVR